LRTRAPVDRVHRTFRADWTAETAAGDIDFEGKSPDDLRSLGQALVGLYVERFANEPAPEGVEVPLVDPRDGRELLVPLVGYYDAVLPGIVREIKTTARKVNGAGDWMLQLSAYAHAHSVEHGAAPRMEVVQLVKTQTPAIVVSEPIITERDEAWFCEIAAETFEAVNNGTFFPNPSWQCANCEYRRACRGLD
jgi:CRISPR/Cas system-associated exonuclease Cas4 (RecB family)